MPLSFLDFFPWPFALNTTLIAGGCLWALTLYLVLGGVRDLLMNGLERWLNWAERSLYLTLEEYEKTRPQREAQNSFYASVLSIVPFLGLGSLCNWGVEWSLGESWGVSLGIMAAMGSGIYELGRRSSSSQE